MKYFLLIASLTWSICSYSQQGIAIFMRMGDNYVSNASDKISQVDRYGISGFSNHFFAVGLDGYLKKNRQLIGGDVMVAGQEASNKGIKYSQPFTSAGHVKVGYTLVDRDRAWLYSTVGIGLSSLSLTNFDMVRGYKHNFEKVFQFTPSVDFGMNCDFILSQVSDNNGFAAVLAGLRVGYRLSAGANHWKKIKGINEESPRFTNNVFYATLSVGSGTFLRKSH